MPFHLAAAQVVSIRDDVTGNIERHIELLELAAEHFVQFAVFPELSLTAYELDLADALTFERNDARLDPLQHACDRLGTTFVVGAPVRLETGLHIGAFVFQPLSEQQVYTKRHLHEGEDRYFVAGALEETGPVPSAEFTVTGLAPGTFQVLLGADSFAQRDTQTPPFVEDLPLAPATGTALATVTVPEPETTVLAGVSLLVIWIIVSMLRQQRAGDQ